MDICQAYRTLELNTNASDDEIKVAYRRLVLESHPDKNSNGKDDSQFKRITEAYTILKNNCKTENNADINAGNNATHDNAGKRSKWGAPKSNPPEQDWSKFTREFEEGDPSWWKEYERKFWEEYDKTINADGHNGEFEKTREPKKQPDVDVNVDPSLCIGCCSCEIIAPSVFHIDKKSNINPKSTVINCKGAGINKIMNAAETCPTKAIRVEDSQTRQRLYPH